MFRKPPTKIEQFQNTLSGALDTIQDAIENLPLDRVRSARDSAARGAAHGWEAALHRAGDAIHTAADVIGDAAGVVSSRAEGALHSAHGAASAARDRLQGRAEDVRDRAGDLTHDLADEAAKRAHEAAHHAHEAAHHAAHHAREAAHRAAHRAHGEIDDKREAWLDAWAEGKKSARKTAHQKRGEAEAALSAGSALAAHALDKARERAGRRGREIVSHVVIEEKPSKTWLWISAGLLGGAALALLLAPESGRRSRDLIKGKLKDAKAGAEGLREAAVGKAHHLENRAAGIMHERAAAKTADDADDNTIADRVRTALGENPATANLERLNIDCVDGLVTVRGPMADEALQAQIVTVIRAVKGVRDVQSDLLLEDAPEDSATFVG